MARIDLFEMERMQSLYWHQVDYDLSESGVSPMSIAELLEGPTSAIPPRSRRPSSAIPCRRARSHARADRAVVSGRDAGNVTVVNGGSEANFLALFTLLGWRRAARVQGAELHAGPGARQVLRPTAPTRSG